MASSWRQARTSRLCALATLSAVPWHATTTTASFQSGCYARSRRRPLRLQRWPCRASSEAWLCNPLRTSSPARQFLSQLAQVGPPPSELVLAHEVFLVYPSRFPAHSTIGEALTVFFHLPCEQEQPPESSLRGTVRLTSPAFTQTRHVHCSQKAHTRNRALRSRTSHGPATLHLISVRQIPQCRTASRHVIACTYIPQTVQENPHSAVQKPQLTTLRTGSGEGHLLTTPAA